MTTSYRWLGRLAITVALLACAAREDRLPPGTIVSFRSPSVWQMHLGYVVGAIVLMLAQSAVIAGLLVQRARRRRVEAALRDSEAHFRATADTAPVMLGEFAATIAHEIRQPLTAIIMNARSCLRGVGTLPELEDVRAGLLDVVEASQRAEEVIQRNRRLFRDRTVETVPLDINGVIRESVALTAARLAEGHVALATTLAEDLPTVGGDRIELQQVLLNLIGNAIDALEAVPPGSRRIDLSSSFDGQGVQVSVIDNGIGFDGVDLRRMFALSYTTKSTGTGVGLSISRSIIEAHGGKLWARPNPSGGAIFSFSLPVRAGVAAA